MCAALKGDDSQIYYSQKVEEIIPNIRFCLYKLGDKTAQKDLIDMKLKSAIGSELADTIDVTFYFILSDFNQHLQIHKPIG